MSATDEPSIVTRRVQSHDGLRLCVDFAGAPRGRPVIMLHGGGQTRHAWLGAVLTLAARGYYVASMDLRGHGDSEWSSAVNYTMESQVGDVLAVMSEMQSPVSLIGASMGGQISLSVAAAEPAAVVRALVLVDVTPRVDREGRARIINFMHSRPDGSSSLDEAADAIAAYLPHRPRPRDLSGLQRNLRLRDDGRYHWHWDQRFLASYVPDADEEEQRCTEAARKIQVPTLLLRGGRSELVKGDNVRHFQELIPHAEFVEVHDAAHMIAGDRNDAFNAAVIEFLDRL
jgi:pimeloyl-ACP methyl ester carboxylesterase